MGLICRMVNSGARKSVEEKSTANSISTAVPMPFRPISRISERISDKGNELYFRIFAKVSTRFPGMFAVSLIR